MGWINRSCRKIIKKRNVRKGTLHDYVERHEEAYRNDKIKSLIDFGEEYSSSIKSLIKKDMKINLTKILMFSKTSI